jgi:hypothetical protein
MQSNGPHSTSTYTRSHRSDIQTMINNHKCIVCPVYESSFDVIDLHRIQQESKDANAKAANDIKVRRVLDTKIQI